MSALESNLESLVDALVPLGMLSPQSQSQVLTGSEILRFDPREFVFRQGDSDPYSFYLLEGRLEMICDGQTIQRLTGGAPDAVHALAQLQPRKMSARAETEVAVLRVSRDLLDKLAAADLANGGGDVQVEEIDADGDGDWMTRMLQSQLFSQLPASNIHRIFSLLETIEVKKGDMVVKQGDPGDYYFVIAQGRCEVTRTTSAKSEGFRLALIGAGDAFGEEALVAGSTRNASVRMLTDGQLVRLPKEAFIELIQTPLLSSVTLEEGRNIAAAKDACWLDVRFPEEFEADGIEGALNHPLNTLRMHSGRLDANKTYIVYCDTGTRSSVAAFLLAERGFSVHCLDGGLMRYEAAAEGTADATPQEAPAVPDPAPAVEGPDMTLSEDAEATEAPASAPIPSSHMSDAERGDDPAVAAAALSVELSLNEMRIADAASRAQPDPEAAAKAEAARREETRKAAEEAAERARAEAEAEAAKQLEAERERVAAEIEKARREAEAQAEQRLAEERKRLEAEAEKARKELEAAQRRKAAEQKKRLEAEALKARQAAEAAQLAKAEEERGKAASVLAEEKRKLEAAAAEARRELAEAQRQKAEIERQKAEAEEAVQREREAQNEKVERVRAEMSRKLAEEERKLRESYAWQADELKRLKSQKSEAEERLREEQERLRQQAEESAARLAEARDYQKRLEEVQQASAAETERREQQQLALEKKLREELKQKVHTERERLEQELARNAAELERARREREAAEAARVAAAEEADRIVAEYKEAHDRKRQQEEADMRVERERLNAEAEQLRLALEIAEREKASALENQARISEEIQALQASTAEDKASLEEDLRELEEQAREAAEHVAEVERSHADARAAAVASVGNLAAHEVHEQQVRSDLEDELNDWLREQEEAENSDVQQSILANQRAHIERIKKRAHQAREAAKAHDQALINELADKLKQRDADL